MLANPQSEQLERLQELADAKSGDSRLDAMKAGVVKDKVRELLSTSEAA